MRRWGFLLKLIPVLCLTASAPVFASFYGYGAIPPDYALGLLFLLSIVLYSEARIRSLGIITFFIGVVVLFSYILASYNNLSEYSLYFIQLLAMLLFLGYLVIGRGLAKGTDNETEFPVLANINLLSVMGLSSGVLFLLARVFDMNLNISVYYTLIAILSSIAVTASLMALRGIMRRNLDYDSQKIPFLYIFNKVIFKPVISGFLCGLSIYFSLFNKKLPAILFFAILFVLCVIVVMEHERTKKRTANLPRHFRTDYFLLFFLSIVAGNGILLIAELSPGIYGSMQSLMYLFSIAGFLYFAFTLITGKYKSLLSSSIKLCLCFPPVLLVILSIAGVLPLNAHISYTRCQSNIKNLGTALEMYSDDNEGKFPDRLQQLCPEYLREIPLCVRGIEKDSFAAAYYCKVCGLSTGDYVYLVSDDCRRFTMYCSGNNHRNVGVGENYPQYNSETGLVAK